MTTNLFNSLKDKIMNKQVVIFGETHGTKEIPLLFSKFLEEYSSIKDFDLCLEIPSNEQENISNFLSTGNPAFLELNSMDSRDGRKSAEILELIKNIYLLNKNISIFCVDLDYNNQLNKINERDNIIAKNIQQNLKDKQLIAFLGNFHAAKQDIIMNNVIFKTTGSILKKELNNSLITINLAPLKGTFFNNSLKNIEKASDMDSFYDIIFSIEKVTPCTLEDK
ncbi:hypothetical protein COS83_03375 [archaeon CG07_land_8_20_14_0_80_38_8]|nr:MAG: hypothetical protein COS83_03375 [archaeon CG07_land_8_20_14_0_80_38_8]